MRFKWTGKRFEWFECDLELWGTIAPPDSERFAVPGSVYLDIGLPGRCVRNLYVENILQCNGTPYTFGSSAAFSGLSYSGLTDTQTAGWANTHIPQFNGTRWVPYIPSLSGLLDVQSDGWVSGLAPVWNGTQFIPSEHVDSISSLTDTDIGGVLTLTSGHRIIYNGQAWVNEPAGAGEALNVGEGDIRYLKLDGSNDPVTGQVDFTVGVSGTEVKGTTISGQNINASVLVSGKNATFETTTVETSTITDLTATNISGTNISGTTLEMTNVYGDTLFYDKQNTDARYEASGTVTDVMKDNVHFFNGSVDNSILFPVGSNGTTVSGYLSDSTGGNLAYHFSGIYYTFTPSGIELTAGTDAAPTQNWVYVELVGSTPTLKKSTVGFPLQSIQQYSPVATVICQSAAGVQSKEPYKVHLWTDHIHSSQYQGHLSDINARLRQEHAVYENGCALTFKNQTGASLSQDVSATQIYTAIATGTVWQMHRHTFSAHDGYAEQASPDTYVINEPSPNQYLRVSGLHSLTQDSLGVSSANKYMNVVIWGVASETGSQTKVMFNLPNGVYSTDAAAAADANKTTIYDIPVAYRGTAFLIARVTVRRLGANFQITDVIDLRGQFPSIFAGGGAAGGGNTVFEDNAFQLQDGAAPTATGQFLLDNVTAGNNRVISWPDQALDLTPGVDLAPSGDYATVSQGHILWAASGNLVVGISGSSQINPVTSIQFLGGSVTSLGHTAFVSGAAGGGGGATTLNALTDTTIGTTASGHILSWDGTAWINADAAAGSSHTLLGASHTDTTGTAASGHTLGFDGTNWRPVFAVPSGHYALEADVLQLDGDSGPITGNITFNDNIQAMFGTGNDCSVYSDGTDLILDSIAGVVTVPLTTLTVGGVTVVTEDRTVTAGAGLGGGGALSGNLTINAIAEPNGGLVVNADSIELDLNNLGEDVSATTDANKFAVYNVLSTSTGYVTWGNIEAAIDHGSIAGLTGDDHTDYYNQARGDVRYALSGNLAPSGNYATVEQGHELWAASGQNIEDHADYARLSLLTSGHLIGFNGTQWVNTTAAAGGSTTLDALTDTTLGVLASGHFLNYNGTTWVNASYFLQPSGYQVPSGIYKVASEFYQPSGYQVPSGDYATVSQGHILWAASGHQIDSHSDYALVSTLASGHQIGWNGTNWVNTTPGTGGAGATTLAGLTDTSVGAVASGHLLGYDGTSAWVPTTPATGGNPTLTITTSGRIQTKTLIGRTTLTANATSISFAAIPSTYDHLEWEMLGRTNRAANNDGANLSFNGDTTAENYDVFTAYGSAEEANVTQWVTASNEDTRRAGFITATTASANEFGKVAGKLNWYSNSSVRKNWEVTSNMVLGTAWYWMVDMGWWSSAASITSIAFTPTTGTNFTSGTIVELYGLKDSWVVTEGTLGDANIVNGMIGV